MLKFFPTLLFATLLPIFVANRSYAEGWTQLTEVVSVGQYGADILMIKTVESVSVCTDATQLYWSGAQAGHPDKFFSALLAAQVSGKKVKIYLHDPVVCGPQNAQKIQQPNYFYVE